MKIDNIIRRQIMIRAWAAFQTGGQESFGLALKASWARERQVQAYAKRLLARAKANGGRLAFGDLTRSPIRRSLSGQAHAGHKAYRAAYTTAVFGR